MKSETASIESQDSAVKGEPAVRPYSVHLRLAIAPWIVHFHTHGYIDEATMRMLELSVVSKTLERTRKSAEVREELGSDPQLWKDLGDLLDATVPSFERRCFAFTGSDPPMPDYEGPTGQLISSNSASLVKDLQRVLDMLSIARNILTIGELGQNLAAKSRFDKHVFKLISLCVKVTARGFDGETGTTDEDKWQSVVNAYKKLLIGCLQFLNNFVVRNERRKLMLWMELFDSSTDGILTSYPGDLATRPDLWPVDGTGNFPFLTLTKNFLEQPGLWGPSRAQSPPTKTNQSRPSSPYVFYVEKMMQEIRNDLLKKGEKADVPEIAAECKRRWLALPSEEKAKWQEMHEEMLARQEQESLSIGNAPKETDEDLKEGNIEALARSINMLQMEVENLTKSALGTSQQANKIDPLPKPAATGTSDASSSLPPLPFKDLQNWIPVTSEMTGSLPAVDADYRMYFDAAYGADILQQGKDDLMKRLEGFERSSPQASQGQVHTPSSPVASSDPSAPQNPATGLIDDLSEEDESDDEDYPVPGDDGRGLLTDVPLILGPNEIEVLPMIVMSGIVPPDKGTPGYGLNPDEVAAIRKMHGVRCHLLLAQDNGRNLLRELLIFVAAWDLREDELYFKFMVKIMEAVLDNGLMPFSYYAFRESKDIISPAQSVIMKLLTSIFRARQAAYSPLSIGSQSQEAVAAQGIYPTRVDVHTVNWLFTEFRRNIIPQTCALIFLQGKIRLGHAGPEDFPLNLWDMERMYEGVYQYLEFFAILTECQPWKRMMADWDIASELVTLLKELDAAIPKGQLPTPAAMQTPGRPTPSRKTSTGATTEPAAAHGDTVPVAVERPYDVSLPEPSSGSNHPRPESLISEPSPYVDEPQDEPSDFEWRNLKKLAILVLSSLVWKSIIVQNQVREHGGIEAVLNCCTFDEHNPYIREHAIMCLRFLLEQNQPNQEVIRNLEPKGVVPNEVLDQHGYETFMDAKGQVGLRRKGGSKPDATASTSGNSTKSAPQPQQAKDPKDLDLLVQQVMRDLPTRIQGTKFDAGEAAALAKLDKTFDSSGAGDTGA